MGADIEAVTPFGETPLHIACYYGAYDVVKTLLSRGANTASTTISGSFNRQSWTGLTPIALASLKTRKAIVELLLESGAQALARPSTLHSLLHLAVAEDSPRVLQMLLEIDDIRNSSILNHQGMYGNTALHLCGGNNSRHDHLYLLLKAGANPNMICKTGHTVMDLAVQSKELIGSWVNSPDLVGYFNQPGLVMDGDVWIPIASPDSEGYNEEEDIEVSADNPETQLEEDARMTGYRLNRDQYVELNMMEEIRKWAESISLLEIYNAESKMPQVSYLDDNVSLK